MAAPRREGEGRFGAFGRSRGISARGRPRELSWAPRRGNPRQEVAEGIPHGRARLRRRGRPPTASVDRPATKVVTPGTENLDKSRSRALVRSVSPRSTRRTRAPARATDAAPPGATQVERGAAPGGKAPRICVPRLGGGCEAPHTHLGPTLVPILLGFAEVHRQDTKKPRGR